jgi:hypothetical protein
MCSRGVREAEFSSAEFAAVVNFARKFILALPRRFVWIKAMNAIYIVPASPARDIFIHCLSKSIAHQETNTKKTEK